MNCIAYRDPRRELFRTLKKETNLFLDSMTPSSAFATLISMKQGEKTYVIASAKEKDLLNITLSNCTNVQMYTSVIIAPKSLLSL